MSTPRRSFSSSAPRLLVCLVEVVVMVEVAVAVAVEVEVVVEVVVETDTTTAAAAALADAALVLTGLSVVVFVVGAWALTVVDAEGARRLNPTNVQRHAQRLAAALLAPAVGPAGHNGSAVAVARLHADVASMPTHPVVNVHGRTVGAAVERCSSSPHRRARRLQRHCRHCRHLAQCQRRLDQDTSASLDCWLARRDALVELRYGPKFGEYFGGALDSHVLPATKEDVDAFAPRHHQGAPPRATSPERRGPVSQGGKRRLFIDGRGEVAADEKPAQLGQRHARDELLQRFHAVSLDMIAVHVR
mmetsp:Transcript_41523/g.95981  ORF Transcript_41523/g.95981 Transcript_41523/m.95981 type:complete len:303 (+) Transcript_41523:116-1024(+)